MCYCCGTMLSHFLQISVCVSHHFQLRWGAFILWQSLHSLFSSFHTNPSCKYVYSFHTLFCVCLHLIYPRTHIPNGHLVSIYIFYAMEGTLLLLRHNTYYCIFNFSNLSFSGSSIRPCLKFWFDILSVLFHFFILLTFISIAHNLLISLSSCTHLWYLVLIKFMCCHEMIHIFANYYSMPKVDSFGSKSGVLAFGSWSSSWSVYGCCTCVGFWKGKFHLTILYRRI